MNRTTIVNIIKAVLGTFLPMAVILMLFGLCHHLERNAEEPLIKAVREKDTKRVESLLRDDVNVNIMTTHTLTPLHIASKDGSKKIVELLLDYGADVNAKTAYNVTPLHFAAQGGNIAIAELLIAKGAQIDAKSDEGLTPLDWIVGRDWASPEMVEFLELNEDALMIWHEIKSEKEYDRVVESLRYSETFKDLKTSRRKRSEE